MLRSSPFDYRYFVLWHVIGLVSMSPLLYKIESIILYRKLVRKKDLEEKIQNRYQNFCFWLLAVHFTDHNYRLTTLTMKYTLIQLSQTV